MAEDENDAVRGQVDGLAVPRFAGPPTFARLPRLDEVARCDLAIVGIPFDSGTTYRPGARFGPAAIRQGSKLLRPYNPAQDSMPFASSQMADAGDITCSPFHIEEAIGQIDAGVGALLGSVRGVLALGGDHTIVELSALMGYYLLIDTIITAMAIVPASDAPKLSA